MEVDFVGSHALQGHMRTILVVPSDKPIEFALEQTRHEWHHGQHSRAAFFQRQNKAFTNGNASSLPDRTSTMTYAVSAAPRSKVGRGELRARVRHEIFGRGPQLSDELAEELPDLYRSRLLLKDGRTQGFSGKMVDDDGHPPAKGPALRQRHW
jgi:hypothetical protein